MEGGESPLEVLSRAATMIQETQQQQALAAVTDENKSSSTTTKQLPTAKWKRERRTRPDYVRKSDPKEAVANGARSSSPTSDDTQTSNSGDDLYNSPKTNNSSYTSNSSSPIINNNHKVMTNDAPLDMTTRQRGLPPPSYSQAISDPNFRSTYTNTNARPPPIARNELPSGISMCDPIIDEHFRRSLGKDYNTVFSNNNGQSTVQKEAAKPPKKPLSAHQAANAGINELMDNTGLSVDEHFAKALGDTWHKLNKKDSGSQSGQKESVNSIGTVST